MQDGNQKKIKPTSSNKNKWIIDGGERFVLKTF